MSTSAASLPDDRDDTPTEDRVVLLRGLTWADYRRLADARGDDGPRMAFSEGDLELMSPSWDHERIKTFLGHLVEAWLVERDVDFIPVGSWTQARDDVQKAVEPDECYVLGSERKARPDLAIEIVWTTRVLDKLPIYAAHEVPEVWIWRRNTLRVFVLREGRYVEASRSELLPDLDLQALLSRVDAARGAGLRGSARPAPGRSPGRRPAGPRWR